MQTKMFKAMMIVVLACGAFALGACQNRQTESTPDAATTSSK
jgi:hypothetical protein